MHFVFQPGTVAQIAKHPSTQTVVAGESAVFNCSLPCSGGPTPVMWFMSTPNTGRSITISQYTPLSQVKSIYGLDLARGSVDECAVGGYRVEQLVLNRVSRQLHMTPVQCATLCFDACPCSDAQVYFSKFAVLLVSGTSAIRFYAYAPTIKLSRFLKAEPSMTVATTSNQSTAGSKLTPTQCNVQPNSASASSSSISVFPTSFPNV